MNGLLGKFGGKTNSDKKVRLENQMNNSVQNTQQTGQNHTNQPTQIPERPKAKYWIFSTVILLTVLLFGGSWYILNSKNKTSSEQPLASTQTEKIEITGVIRTSGLSDEEKLKFGLTAVNYQITDFGDYQKAYREGIVMGYFLFSDNLNGDELGKCVRITGSIPEEWKSKDKADAYNRSVLSVTNLERIDNSNCNPYGQTELVTDNTQEKSEFL